MTRDAFLKELRIALQGQISQVQVNEQLSYYENYLIEESRKGRTEEEVLQSLGNPRLIAKTIIQMYASPVNSDTHENDADDLSEEKDRGRHTKTGRLRRWFMRSMSVIGFAVFLLFLVRIGILLLPIVASFFMIGAICYVIFIIFFGNKK